MINGYIVKYHLGKKTDTSYQLWIAAHDEAEARKLCVIQAKYRHGQSYKINIISTRGENEQVMKAPVKKVPELARVIKSNEDLIKAMEIMMKGLK
ncbi:MAG: hypothetical protein MUO26_00415 [Methanotrichaceae archaeon]|nr:hypothetical protein [Methanotrichaceae archaeon]